MSAEFDADQITRELNAGLARLELGLSADAPATLVAFIRELARWNKAYNLTAVRDPAEMIPRHVLDSLTALSFIHGERVLDAGCGAGLPGFPLAIAAPATQFVLLDSNSKKQRFVEHVCRTLQLANVEPAHARVEQYHAPLFNTIICRALTSLAAFVSDTEHLLAPGGRWVAMKGRLPEAEISGLPSSCIVTGRYKVEVPGLDGERHIICIEKSQT